MCVSRSVSDQTVYGRVRNECACLLVYVSLSLSPSHPEEGTHTQTSKPCVFTLALTMPNAHRYRSPLWTACTASRSWAPWRSSCTSAACWAYGPPSKRPTHPHRLSLSLSLSHRLSPHSPRRHCMYTLCSQVHAAVPVALCLCLGGRCRWPWRRRCCVEERGHGPLTACPRRRRMR
jgi:hypothetical protein